MKSKIDVDHISTLAHLILTKEERRLLEPQMIKILFSNRAPFLIGKKEDPIAMYVSDIFTETANLAGIPAISFPVGLSKQRRSVGL